MAHRIFEAGREVLRPIVFAIGIIIIVYLPILSFENVEGKMFRPMALTVIFALAGSLLCALTYVPVMASLLLRASRPMSRGSRDNATAFTHACAAQLDAAARVVLGTSAWCGGSLGVAPLLGTEFVPTLDEGTYQSRCDADSEHLAGRCGQECDRGEKAMLELPE